MAEVVQLQDDATHIKLLENTKDSCGASMANCSSEPVNSVLSNRIANTSDINDLLNVVKELKAADVRSSSCEIVQHVWQLLDGESDKSSSISIAEKILCRLAGTVDSKEFLVLVIEQVREQWTDAKFHSLLVPLRRTVHRMNPPVAHSLAFTLDALTEFITALPVPVVADLERKERMLLDGDPSVCRICDLVPRYLSFVRPFVKRIFVSRGEIHEKRDADIDKQIHEITRCLITVIDRPLGRLDLLLLRGQASSTARLCAQQGIRMLGSLHADFIRLILNMSEQPKLTEQGQISPPNLGTFAFLAVGENLCPDHIPSVYSQRFLLELSAPLAADLLETGELLPRLHGIRFYTGVLLTVESDSLPAELIESEEMRRLVLAVLKATVNTKSTELSSSLLKILHLICKSLEPHGKLQYLFAMLKIAPRSGGVIGCIIELLTGEILANIDKADQQNNVFARSELERVLHLVFALPNGEKTDLLENTERIMSAMKFLKIVLPRDPKSRNVTGIWDLISLIEDKYFRLLFAGIELSRAHYRLEIQKLKELPRAEATNREFVSGGSPVELSKHQQLGVLETAVHTFDMLENVAKKVLDMIRSMKSA